MFVIKNTTSNTHDAEWRISGSGKGLFRLFMKRGRQVFHNTSILVFFFYIFPQMFHPMKFKGGFCFYMNIHNCLRGYIFFRNHLDKSHTLSENTDPVWLKHVICSKYFNILVFFFIVCMFNQRNASDKMK